MLPSETVKRFANSLSKWRLALVLVLIFGVATALRFAALDWLPPGPFRDEAFNGLNASRIWDLGDVQPFYATNSGREGMIVWLVALAIRLGGHTTLALRVTSALIGTLTVLIAYPSYRLIFGAHPRRQAIALLGTAAMAVSLWHVHFSRLALRANLVPLFALVTFGTFLLAWRTNRLPYFALTGLFLGLSLYTYLSARLLPIVLLAFLALEAGLATVRFLHRCARRNKSDLSDLRKRLVGLLLLLLIVGLITLPLGLYFTRHPQQVGFRVANVSILAPHANQDGKSAIQLLLGNAVTTLRMFIDRGDQNPRHGLPYQAALDPHWLDSSSLVCSLE